MIQLDDKERAAYWLR